MTVYDGDRVTMPCRPCLAILGGTVRWSHTRSHGAPQHIIFDRNAVDLKYMNDVTVNTDHSSRDYDLTLHVVKLNKYGWYICFTEHDDGSTFIHAVLLAVKG